MDYESGMSTEERGGANCQTDLIGIDFIVTPTGTGIMPYVIEVRRDVSFRTNSPSRSLLHITLVHKKSMEMKNRIDTSISDKKKA